MARALPLLCVAVLLTAAAGADDRSITLSFDGLGPLKFGMEGEQVQHVLHRETPYNLAASNACTEFSTPQLEPLGLSFVLENNRLIRINVQYASDRDHPGYKTDAGIGIGSTEADVLKAYPGAAVKANPADPAWHTIRIETPDRRRGLIFETNGQTVKSMRGGETATLSLENACG